MKLRWMLAFAGGLVAGMALHWALEVLLGRQGAPGGEVLLPLLAGLLVWYGMRELVGGSGPEGSENDDGRR